MREYEVWLRSKTNKTWTRFASAHLEDVLAYLVEFHNDAEQHYDGFRIETYKDNWTTES